MHATMPRKLGGNRCAVVYYALTAQTFSAGTECRHYRYDVSHTLDDQTQVDSKPAGQPEHASLNQCQLIAANRPKLVLWAPSAGGGD